MKQGAPVGRGALIFRVITISRNTGQNNRSFLYSNPINSAIRLGMSVLSRMPLKRSAPAP